MSAIGPGDFVQRIKPLEGCAIMRPGTIWLVSKITPFSALCEECGSTQPGICLANDPLSSTMRVLLEVVPEGYCPCGFRPYHGPEQSSILQSKEIELV